MELIYEGVGKKVYRDGDRLIKSFDETYSKADILNEALNQARVEQTSLNIPKILGVSVVDGKWSVIWEFIEGETLEKMMKDHPEKEDEYLDFFVDLQIRMSKEKVPLLGHLRDKMHAKISASSYPASVRYDLHVRLDGLPRHTKLCHGDFQPSNIIITKEGTPYIIDWSHATQGNGSADAARTYLLFKLHKQDELAEKYLRLFCTKTDTAIQYVQRVLPIVAASQSVKHKPEEAEFLAKWVNVCDWQKGFCDFAPRPARGNFLHAARRRRQEGPPSGGVSPCIRARLFGAGPRERGGKARRYERLFGLCGNVAAEGGSARTHAPPPQRKFRQPRLFARLRAEGRLSYRRSARPHCGGARGEAERGIFHLGRHRGG